MNEIQRYIKCLKNRIIELEWCQENDLNNSPAINEARTINIIIDDLEKIKNTKVKFSYWDCYDTEKLLRTLKKRDEVKKEIISREN